MKKAALLIALSLSTVRPACAGLFRRAAAPADLQCEYLKDPLGIDAAKPRLSWKLAASGLKPQAGSQKSEGSGQNSERTSSSLKPLVSSLKSAPPLPRGLRQTAYRILVASDAQLLEEGKANLWDSGKVAGDQTLNIEYQGKPLTSRMKCFWKVCVWTRTSDRGPRISIASPWSQPACWEMGLIPGEPWQAQWIVLKPEAGGTAAFPLFRQTFVLDSAPREARAYITSLGYHELYINGAKVGDDVLSPAVAQLSARSWYRTHDITPYLRKGTNCVGLAVGRGWFFRQHEDYANVQRTGGRPAAMAQLEVRLADGRRALVGTDASWQAAPSPFTSATHWGLRYDARQEQPGWNTPVFDSRAWKNAEVVTAPMPPPCAQMVEPNRIVRELAPQKIEAQGTNTWMVDFGTNVAGWCTLRLHDSREAGRKIVLQYGDDPLCDQDREEYITSGKGEECFQPRLSYQAFRYVKLSGCSRAPAPADLTASLIRTGYGAGSSFACSSPRITAVHDMIAYTFQCLTLGGYMVDCPHIERLGYGGDGQASSESAMLMYPLDPLYRNWLTAWRDVQSPDGDMPHTAPIEFAGGGPYWCGFIIAVPWQLYVQYGDRRVLSENYPAMQKWLGFVEQHCRNGDLQEPWPNNNRRNWYLGDWAVPDGVNQRDPESIKLVVNGYRIYCYDLMARIAAALERNDEAAQYRAKADSLRPIVHRALYNPAKGTYATGGQLELALPLLTGMVPQELRADIIRQLEQDILVKRGGHLAVGLVGVPLLTQSLLALNRNDLIFRMVDADTYPGWGHMIKQGATTTWEHWNGARSRIHNCYNGIGMWFYEGLGGIRPDPAAPGFRHFIVRPAVVGGLTWVKARLPTVRGEIVSEWQQDRGFTLHVVVPPNATATVYVPAKSEKDVTESEHRAASASGVKFLRMENGAALFEVGSGSYTFKSPAL